ncbi:hypothetical protein BHE74_00046352, partial [Ensete ventricosum]
DHACEGHRPASATRSLVAGNTPAEEGAADLSCLIIPKTSSECGVAWQSLYRVLHIDPGQSGNIRPRLRSVSSAPTTSRLRPRKKPLSVKWAVPTFDASCAEYYKEKQKEQKGGESETRGEEG